MKLLLVPIYSLLHSIKTKLKHLYAERQKLCKKLSKYFSYSFLAILILLTGWQGLEAQNTTPEEFGKNTLAFSLTKTGEDFEINEEITEGPLIGEIQSSKSFLEDEALSENDLMLIEPDLSSSWRDNLATLTPDESALEAPEIGDTSLTEARRSEVIEYVVESGDILGSIAEKFEISVATILWANDLSFYSVIRPGQKLKILPTDGLIYTIKKGDALEKIAKTYQSDINDIIESNKLESIHDIIAGQDLLLPGGIKPTTYTPTTRTVASVFTPAPAASSTGGGELLWPTNSTKITQYFKWRHSGLDISNKTGQPIYASESGKVTAAGWNNGGYGYYVIINHGNGLETLYAHASKLYVSKGDTVSRGDVIAAIGSTGWSTGPHIHYEVRVNNVRKNPLDYIK